MRHLCAARRTSGSDAYQLGLSARDNGKRGGEREITAIECEPTTDDTSPLLDVSELSVGSWEIRFVVPSDFDGSEAIFKRFERHKLDPDAVFNACDAARPLQD